MKTDPGRLFSIPISGDSTYLHHLRGSGSRQVNSRDRQVPSSYQQQQAAGALSVVVPWSTFNDGAADADGYWLSQKRQAAVQHKAVKIEERTQGVRTVTKNRGA